MTGNVTESRFYMWRALFAIAHADDKVCSEERHFMHKILQDYPFTAEQARILEADMAVKQDVAGLFEQITNPQDRSQFFDYARTLVWCDGDYGAKEQEALLKLNRAHVLSADFDTLDETAPLELDDGEEDAHLTTPQRREYPVKTGFLARLCAGLLGQGKRR